MLSAAVICCKENTVATGKGKTLPDTEYYSILGYGLPDMDRQILSYGISEKWKIVQLDVAGCDVTQELMDSIAVENGRTYAALEKKYGKDWEARYEKDLQDFALKRAEVIDVLMTNPIFRKKLRQCNMAIDRVNKDIIQLDMPGLYKATVYSYDKDFNRTDCCKVEVDLNKRTVNLIQ